MENQEEKPKATAGQTIMGLVYLAGAIYLIYLGIQLFTA